MKTELQVLEGEVKPIFEEIKTLINTSRAKAYYAVNTEMLNLHWKIGKRIFEIQDGGKRATYGDELVIRLSEQLTKEFGKGFSARNLRRMRKFYVYFPIWPSVMTELSWTHYLEIISIDR